MAHTQSHGSGIAAQFNPGCPEGQHGPRQKLSSYRRVNQQGLDRVASSRVLGFGIQRHLQSQLKVGSPIHEQVADAVGMTKHWNPGVVLDEAHQGIGAPGNDQVHQAVELQQPQAFLPTGEQLEGVGVHRTGGQATAQRCMDGLTAAAGFAATLEQGAVAGANCQGGDLHHRIWPRLKDHAQHPQGHRQPLQHQPRI